MGGSDIYVAVQYLSTREFKIHNQPSQTSNCIYCYGEGTPMLLISLKCLNHVRAAGAGGHQKDWPLSGSKGTLTEGSTCRQVRSSAVQTERKAVMRHSRNPIDTPIQPLMKWRVDDPQSQTRQGQ